MRDLILFLGLVVVAIFGSMVESTGWAGIVALLGVAGGLVLLAIGGIHQED